MATLDEVENLPAQSRVAVFVTTVGVIHGDGGARGDDGESIDWDLPAAGLA